MPVRTDHERNEQKEAARLAKRIAALSNQVAKLREVTSENWFTAMMATTNAQYRRLACAMALESVTSGAEDRAKYRRARPRLSKLEVAKRSAECARKWRLRKKQDAQSVEQTAAA